MFSSCSFVSVLARSLFVSFLILSVHAQEKGTSMKTNEHLFAQPAWEEGNVQLMRSGKSGNSKELLTTDQQHQIDAHCLRELERIGSDFPYRDKFNVTIP